MSTRGDVNQIVFVVRIKRIGTSEFEKRLVNEFEVPWVAEFNFMQPHGRFRRDRSNIARYPKKSKSLVAKAVQVVPIV